MRDGRSDKKAFMSEAVPHPAFLTSVANTYELSAISGDLNELFLSILLGNFKAFFVSKRQVVEVWSHPA